MQIRIQAIGTVLCGMFLVGSLGCDGGGNDKPPTSFSAFVKDRIPKTPKGEMVVVALDNATGEVLAGVAEQTSDSSGMVYFDNLPGDAKGKVGFLVRSKVIGGVLKYVDTYQFNIDVTAKEEELWALDKWTYDNAPGMGGLTVDSQYALFAGAMYYVNDAGEEEPVGCATAEITVGDWTSTTAEVRYFNDKGLPTKLATDAPADTTARDVSNPKNGLFTGANIRVGNATIKMKDSTGKVVGTETTIMIKKDAVTDALLISNVYVDKTIQPTNPTPAVCP